MKTFPKWLKGILLAALTSTALAGCNSNPILGLVPEEWYLLPEKSNHTPNASSKEQEAALGKHVDLLFQTQGQALATLPELTPDQAPLPAGHPADWVPWHLEYLMTDLSVSASGVLGSLTLKGTPDITAMWRRQYTPGRESTPPNANDVSDSAARADLVVNETTRASDIAIQLEPAINAAVLSGKVKDEKRLRENLTRVAGDPIVLLADAVS